MGPLFLPLSVVDVARLVSSAMYYTAAFRIGPREYGRQRHSTMLSKIPARQQVPRLIVLLMQSADWCLLLATFSGRNGRIWYHHAFTVGSSPNFLISAKVPLTQDKL